MQTDLFSIVSALAMGTALGLFYFGGLWYTVKEIRNRKHPYRLIGLSFLVRTIVCLSGFLLILKQGLFAFFLTFVTFLLIRVVLTRKLGPVKGNAPNGNQS